MIFDKPKVLPSDIPKIISPYPFGEMVSCKNLGGIPNNTYKVITSQKTFVVRIYSIGQSSLEHIKCELDILQHLERENFISPRVIAGINGEILQYWGKYPVVATEFIEGVMAEDMELTPELSYNIGKLFNTFRKAMKSYVLDPKYQNENIFNRIDDVMPSIHEDLKKRETWKMDISKVLMQSNRSAKLLKDNKQNLIQNVIHFDFWPPNLKCIGNEIVGLMDFDDWCYGPTFLDFAVAFVECAMLKGAKINEQIAISLFKGYFENGGTFTKLEEDLLTDAIEMICCLMLGYNIIQAPEFQQANIYLERLQIFINEETNKKFRSDIANYIKIAKD